MVTSGLPTDRTDRAEPDSLRASAIANALAQAIAEVRGVFVRHETRYVQESISSTIADLDVRTSTSFMERVESRSSGVVTDYTVLEESIDPSTNLPLVTLRSNVCMDPKLAVHAQGSSFGRGAFLEELSNVLEASGWTATTTSFEGPAAQVALDAGATHVAYLQFRTRSEAPWRGLERVTVSMDARIVDMLGETFLTGFVRTETGTGRTFDEAVAATVTTHAAALAGGFHAAFGVPSDRRVVLDFDGVTRSHVPIELEALLLESGHVDEVGTEWDRDASLLTLVLHGEMSACDLAERVTRTRRMLVRTVSCDEDSARLEVLRQ